MTELDDAEDLLRLALEFWCREEPIPSDVQARIKGTPPEMLSQAWDRITREAGE